LEGVEPPRPFTHDLFLTAIGELSGSITRIVVTEMREHTFYAEIHLDAAGEERVISSRPSDAIALAVRCGAPLFAEDLLLDEHGRLPEPEPEQDAAEIIDEFKDFLEHVDPGDFG
ncbi:MAG: bifunctional nuclease family protein, partial [Actinomycetota bacterium]